MPKKKVLSGLPDFTLEIPKNLTSMEKDIFALILENWPTSALEIAENFKEKLASREDKRRASTKYSYYLQKLVGKKLLMSKRVGNALIVWPLKVEKYRTIEDILKEESEEASD